MIDSSFYVNEVLPQIDPAIRHAFFEQYPNVVLEPTPGSISVTDCPVLMVIGMTGAGKTTTLNTLDARRTQGMVSYVDGLPSRRVLADMIVIPTAQVLLSEPVEPIRDRVERFRLTGTFASHVPGGMAAAYSWLRFINKPNNIIVSEGIRGAREINHALDQCTHWHLIELVASPFTRLQRLSNRQDNFDSADGSTDVAFLQPAIQGDVLVALQTGVVSPTALAILRAEAENYDLFSEQPAHPRYTCIDTDNQTQYTVLEQVTAILQRMACYA